MQKDPLFTTSVIINGEHKSYRVTFENEAYQFTGEDNNAPSFQVRREEDTWKPDGTPDEISGRQAISALEHYLLSQH